VGNMAGPAALTIPITELKERVCKCGSEIFVQALRLREVPAIYSPSGKPSTMRIEVGYLCAHCGCSLSKVHKTDEKTLITEKDMKHA